ncbi:MAG: Uma2 family endonuclease [Anaerolineae bacterium]|nr:Uma2 family endonuclease [Anaerolineae bacterium]
MVDFVQTRMTSAEYWQQPETNRIEELIDGELIVTPPPLDAHQDKVTNIAVYVKPLTKGGQFRVAPTGVHFEDGYDFEPDIFWIAPDNDHCILAPDGRYWQGAPDFIVEVLSPTTAYRDRGIKFETYQRHGVREYWLVDPEAAFIEVYRLENEQFVRLGLFKAGETFASPVLGVDVSVDALLG